MKTLAGSNAGSNTRIQNVGTSGTFELNAEFELLENCNVRIKPLIHLFMRNILKATGRLNVCHNSYTTWLQLQRMSQNQHRENTSFKFGTSLLMYSCGKMKAYNIFRKKFLYL